MGVALSRVIPLSPCLPTFPVYTSINVGVNNVKIGVMVVLFNLLLPAKSHPHNHFWPGADLTVALKSWMSDARVCVHPCLCFTDTRPQKMLQAVSKLSLACNVKPFNAFMPCESRHDVDSPSPPHFPISTSPHPSGIGFSKSLVKFIDVHPVNVEIQLSTSLTSQTTWRLCTPCTEAFTCPGWLDPSQVEGGQS